MKSPKRQGKMNGGADFVTVQRGSKRSKKPRTVKVQQPPDKMHNSSSRAPETGSEETMSNLLPAAV